MEDLKGKISGVIEGGATGVGLESTVVDATGEIPIILRPGNVTLEDIKKNRAKCKDDQCDTKTRQSA